MPWVLEIDMHYAFDRWMEVTHEENPWARFADDAVIHCRSKEAEKLKERLRSGVPNYVATPLGTLRRYDPSDGSDVQVYDDIPWDPNHPSRYGG